MNMKSMTDQSIAAELGRRIEQMRLEQNLTQQQVADEIGISRVSYRKLVNGTGKFENIIAVLRALGHLDLVENFIPETSFSPMEQLKLRGKTRRRATGSGAKNKRRAQDNKKSNEELDW